MKKIAFLTEPRKHKALEFVLQNFISVLPSDWKIQVNHGVQNLDYLKSIIDKNEVISNSDLLP